jgi:type II secretory ATPase GspE/PulE/Tfp pilus assembly ATPase PilB-like protein
MKEQKLLREICPRCSQVGTLRKIVYGMPSADFNFEKYIVGGCIQNDEANTGCLACEWEGIK